ncbi:metallopeptidase [Patescibacteria group bacterium]|nr:metallopeptidase [Patescibacteria group bacterium]MBU1473218.1 metallopeptidase [Patescibacteria group bacterium]MBU2459924.1 metallopeptidase [Patescibacteria group bacterium]MBU2544133.1 metallopeptidase [Patescibacteria group bacterium]
MQFVFAPDVQKILRKVLTNTPFDYVLAGQIVCMRSLGSSSRARARIWSFPRVWQIALGQKPHYVIEVLSEHFDQLSPDDKVRVIIHELMHIPKNFSGALVPHRGIHKKINNHAVEKIFTMYERSV